MADITLDPTKVRPLKGSDVAPAVAGMDMTIGSVVRTDNNGNAQLADFTASGLLGIVAAAGSPYRPDGSIKAGEGITVLWHGRVALNTGALLAGQPYYASANAGKLADTVGATVRAIGAAESSNVFNFNGHKVE